MLLKSFVLLFSLSLVCGTVLFPLREPMSDNRFPIQSRGQSLSDDSSSDSYYDKSSESSEEITNNEISTVIITRDVNETLGLHPTAHVEQLDLHFSDVRGSVLYTLGARSQCKFVFDIFVLKIMILISCIQFMIHKKKIIVK